MIAHTARYIGTQLVIWAVGWLVILLILSNDGTLDSRFWHRTILILIGVTVVVLLNLKYLLPLLYFKNRRFSYIFYAILLLTVVVWVVHSDLLPWNHLEMFEIKNANEGANIEYIDGSNDNIVKGNFRWFIRNLPPLFISLLGSSLVSIGRFANEKEKEAIQLEKAKLETEVKFLKSQINPHFLFNTLHNIYALTIMDSEKASEQLLKLSDILRYMLYDSNEERVPLEREVLYLESYLELAKLKDSRGMNVRFEHEYYLKGIKVAPLLFITFVENAFKHSQIEDLKNGYVHIVLETFDNGVVFTVDNSKPKNKYSKDRFGGIGLNNIQHRLKLLYPDKHQLLIEETENVFKVYLKLDCS